MMMKQIWKCLLCKHEFYTPIKKKQSIVRRIFRRKEKIECLACGELFATRNRVIRFKEKKDEKTLDNPFDAGNFTDQPGSEK